MFELYCVCDVCVNILNTMPYNLDVFICCYICESMYHMVKVELQLSFVCHEYTEDVKAPLHSVLMWMLDGNEWSRSRSGHFMPIRKPITYSQIMPDKKVLLCTLQSVVLVLKAQ
jgi:hypothetical protein